ncbi:olfactory receptor 14K1-like [Tachyglossus aculeatus]|uniref:olfactory receptor 14K1-like n=1 Tax=Tachyglossus aculeatus TaxID=9261 RepID=UPI0018F330F0|nr:olfactory receptor 14K1-like [Tachyglossus aculeatus]
MAGLVNETSGSRSSMLELITTPAVYKQLFPITATKPHEETRRRNSASPTLDRPAALPGNLLIVADTAFDQRLHTHMYFCMRNLSVLDICYISFTTQKSILNSMIINRSIYFRRCMAQVFLVVLFGGSELSVLMGMPYDRYAAICHPLRYDVVMNRVACERWLPPPGSARGCLGPCAQPGCSHLASISCSETHIAVDVSLVMGIGFGFFSYVSIVISYVNIFLAELRQSSDHMVKDTAVRDFLWLGFPEVRKLQLVHAALFLLVYPAALTGNLLIDVPVHRESGSWMFTLYSLHPLSYTRHLSIINLYLRSVTSTRPSTTP